MAAAPQRRQSVHRPSAALQTRSATQFQLDQCLNAKTMDKLINQMSSTAETRQKSRMKHMLSSGADASVLTYDVDGFAEYLAQTKALGTLLFWKDAEDYTTLFGTQERVKTAEKIYTRYLAKGSEFELNGATEEQIAAVQAQMKEPPEEIFVTLQEGAYNQMQFQLFPAFWEYIKQQDKSGGKRKSAITEKTTLREIIAANDLEIHLFAEFCRAQLCEESVTFLLEAGMFSLLFDPLDLENQAARIFKLYLDPTSEERISGASDKELFRIQGLLQKAGVLEKLVIEGGKEHRESTRRDSLQTSITPQLFDTVKSEVEQTLSMDVWPRYKEAVLSGAGLEGANRGGTAPATNSEDLRTASKSSVMAVLKDKKKLVHLRNVAQTQGMVENVDFCCEVQEYKLLFSEADRKPRAETLYKTYIMAGADLPVNIPDSMSQAIEKNMAKYPADLFEDAYQELLNVIQQNIYGEYLKELDKHAAAAAPQPAPGPAKPPPAASGGCCLLM